MTWDFHVTGDNDGEAQELFTKELRELSGPDSAELRESLGEAALQLGYTFSHHHQVSIHTKGYLLESGVGSVTVTVSVVPNYPPKEAKP